MHFSIIVRKVREKGFIGTLKALTWRGFRLINLCAYYYYSHKPINQKLIVMESEGDLSDNSYAFFDYMNKQGFLGKYHVVWMVDNLEKSRSNKFPNTSFCMKSPKYIDIKWAKALAVCHWFIYDHCDLMGGAS